MDLRSPDLPAYAGDQENLDRFRAARTPFFQLTPDPTHQVVLGCGTPVEPDVRRDNCLADGVPLVRRKGGGGAVVLGPGILVITGCFPPVAGRFPENWLLAIASLVSSGLTAALAPTAPQPDPGPPFTFVIRGTGDICLRTAGAKEVRKVLGSSLYVARDVVLYQGSLLVSANLSDLPRYLGTPSRQPDYRCGRSHLDFVSNLPEGWRLDLGRFAAALNLAAQSL
ncbi:MAG: lipoyl protein ligase domain-containing protein [Methanocella sp.]